MSMLYSIFFSKIGKNLISREFYECGFKVINDNNIIMDIQFSIIGLIFLIYELEILLFVPVFLNYQGYSIFLIIFIIISLIIISLSYIYELEKFSLNLNF